MYFTITIIDNFSYLWIGVLNPYQNTIQAVGGILDKYDSDKMYPVYGFGAKVTTVVVVVYTVVSVFYYIYELSVFYYYIYCCCVCVLILLCMCVLYTITYNNYYNNILLILLLLYHTTTTATTTSIICNNNRLLMYYYVLYRCASPMAVSLSASTVSQSMAVAWKCMASKASCR